MSRRFRLASGLLGLTLAVAGLWAVLAPASIRELLLNFSPQRLPVSFSKVVQDSGSARVCMDSLEDMLPGSESKSGQGRAADSRGWVSGSGEQPAGFGTGLAWAGDGTSPRPSARASASARPGRIRGAREATVGDGPRPPRGPMVQLGPDAALQDYLQAEVAYLTLLRQMGRELRDTVTRLWAARARRRRALAAWEVAMRRLRAQKARVDRRTKELSSFYQTLYKLVDGWDQIPLLDRRNTAPPLDGRMELLSIIRHLRQELDAEKTILASLDADRKRALNAMERAKTSEASLDALRDGLSARIARAQQELSDLRRLKEHRNRSREVWDRRARQLHKAVVELEEDLRRQAQGFDSLKGRILRPVPGIVLPYPGDRTHKAVLVGAEPGWWARAPATGRVVSQAPCPGSARW